MTPAVLPPGFWPIAARLVADCTWPPESPAGARAFVDGCVWHGILSLLFLEDDLPPALEAARAAEAMRERVAALRVRVFHENLVRMREALADEPFILLKGADFMYRLYPEPHLRPLQDIDVLVPRSRFPAVCERLQGAGFAELDIRTGAMLSPEHHERSFSAGSVTIDVHQAFIQESRHRIDYDGVWARRQTLQVRDRSFWRLSDADALAYHALSMANDQFQLPLVRYVDLWLLMQSREGAVLDAARRSLEWKSARAFYGALSLASRLFPAFRTPEVEAAKTHVLGRLSRRFVDRWVLPSDAELRNTGRLPSRPLQLWRKAFLLDTWTRRISFPLHHAIATMRSGAHR